MSKICYDRKTFSFTLFLSYLKMLQFFGNLLLEMQACHKAQDGFLFYLLNLKT